MNEINYPHVRQVILNDRSILDRPDYRYLLRVANILPDARVHGFGRMFDGTWYLLLESLFFPYHIESMGTRGAIPATTLPNYRDPNFNTLHKKSTI